MKKLKTALLVGVLVLTSGVGVQAQQGQGKPKLIVGIVVDQMRNDYLSRYYGRFTDGGFKRLLDNGYQFANAHYNYKATSTGPGHASIYTGTTPSRHGIISNSWYDKTTEAKVNCVVMGSGENSYVAPSRLEVTTVTDELRLYSNHRSKVVSMSFKDRGATLPAGHNPSGAYWYNRKNGEMGSSTYFTEELPKWVKKFNAEKRAHDYASRTWETLHPIETYTASIADANTYEKIKWGKKDATFPYDLANDKEPLNRFTGTPFANQMLTDFALAALEGEQLGKGQQTDFLAISYSSTDIAGHAMAPRAVEIEDMYLRLDRDIKRLLDQLDAQVGQGNYMVFLSADHGAVDNPKYLSDNQYPGGRFQRETAMQVYENVAAKYGKADWFKSVSVHEIYLDRKLIAEKGLDLEEFQEFLASALLELPFVSEAFTATELRKRNQIEAFAQMMQRSYHSKRSGDVFTIMKSGYLHGQHDDRGTSHGTPYNYDTHIPILFYGSGIPAGSSVRKVSITDIAPTVSMKLGIPLPSAATGLPLYELFK